VEDKYPALSVDFCRPNYNRTSLQSINRTGSGSCTVFWKLKKTRLTVIWEWRVSSS